MTSLYEIWLKERGERPIDLVERFNESHDDKLSGDIEHLTDLSSADLKRLTEYFSMFESDEIQSKKATLSQWIIQKLQIPRDSFSSFHKNPKVLEFVNSNEECTEDEMFILLSIQWSKQDSQVVGYSERKPENDSSKIDDLFGPNVFEKVQKKTYPIALKLKTETFLVLINEISAMKTKLLQKLENLVLLIIEWLGKFQQLIDLSDTEKWLFIWNYIHEDKNKIYKEYLNVKCIKGQLADMLNIFGLPEFIEPDGKSLQKIDALYNLLKETEESQWLECCTSIDRRLKTDNDNFSRIESDFELGLESIESDIDLMYRVNNYELRIIRFREVLNDLREFNELLIELVRIKEDIKSVSLQLNRGFNQQRYSTSIETFKMKLTFLRDLLISGLETIKNQMIEKRDVIKIYKISQKTRGETIHKMIKESFDLEDVDAIHLIFNKYDLGSKGYLTRSEFLKAFGFIYPTMTEDALVEVFDVICSNKGRRQVTFKEFSMVSNRETQSIEMSPIVESSSTFDNDEVIKLRSDFHLKSFNELSSGKGYLTGEDFDNIQLNDKLRSKIIDIFPENDNKFDYKAWFETPESTDIYKDKSPCNDLVSIKDILYDLERVDIDSLT